MSGNITTTPEYPCASCHAEVRPRQQALRCDRCNAWQHRKCQTDISQQQYWQINKGLLDIGLWYCCKCPAPEQNTPLQLPLQEDIFSDDPMDDEENLDFLFSSEDEISPPLQEDIL